MVGANPMAAATLVEALVGTVPHVAATPDGCYLTIRAGHRPSARAFVPGYRQPRPYPVPDTPAGGVAGAWSSRPPRGIEIGHDAALLERLTLVVAPPVAGGGPAAVRVILDLVERGAALIFVTDTTAPVAAVDTDLLAAAVRRTRDVFLAVADDHESERWPEVVGANQSRLARQVPELTLARWFVVVRRPWASGAADPGTGRGAADPGVVGPEAVPAGGDGAAELREALVEWADAERTRRRTGGRGRSARAVRVGAHSADCGWERVLERSIRVHRHASGQEISIELSRIHLRCAQHIADHGCAALPVVLDRELHGLSLLATRVTRIGAQETLSAVLGQVLERQADHDLMSRVIPAVRARLAGAEQARWDRALLVITAGGVAEVVGGGALAGLGAYRPQRGGGTPGEPVTPPLLAPFGLALAAGCYTMWARAGAAERKRCRQWLQGTVRALENTLHRELTERFDDLHRGIRMLVGESVDRGVLQI